MSLPSPMLTIQETVRALKAEGLSMTGKQVRRWLLERAALRTATGEPSYPGLLQGSHRKWLVQGAALARVIGHDRVGVEAMCRENSARIDIHELRLERLEAKLRMCP